MELHLIYKPLVDVDKIHQYTNHKHVICLFKAKRCLCSCDCGEWFECNIRLAYQFVHIACDRADRRKRSKLTLRYVQNDDGVFYNVIALVNRFPHDLGNYKSRDEALSVYEHAKEIYKVEERDCAKRI